MCVCVCVAKVENTRGSIPCAKQFLYMHLRELPIWGTLRFWNAAFFDALQCERSLRPVATRQDLQTGQQAVSDELHYQENITFGQLGLVGLPSARFIIF